VIYCAQYNRKILPSTNFYRGGCCVIRGPLFSCGLPNAKGCARLCSESLALQLKLEIRWSIIEYHSEVHRLRRGSIKVNFQAKIAFFLIFSSHFKVLFLAITLLKELRVWFSWSQMTNNFISFPWLQSPRNTNPYLHIQAIFRHCYQFLGQNDTFPQF